MSIFTIEFQQMFLLVNRLNGASVLLPADKHTTTLSAPFVKESITLSGTDVFIREAGVDLLARPTLRPGTRYLPYLDYVFHADVVPRSSMSALVVPPALNARVLLAGGFLTELPAEKKEFADVMWNFVKPDGQVVLRQALTDRLLFTLELDEGTAYELIIRQTGADPGKDTVIPIPAEGGACVIANKDDTPKPRSADGIHRLTEYALLYNLTTASTLSTLYPYPVADLGNLGGDDQPICGGGQTDDGEDPTPP